MGGGALLLGLLTGLRHALEPDHLAAVSTLVARGEGERRWRVGALWGLGHALALVAVGGLLVGLETALPPALSAGLELAVAAMLVGLGAFAVRGALAEVPHHEDAHALGLPHLHAPVGAPPLLVGLMHGLAGSGALTALAMAAMPTTPGRLIYAALFGLGSILGMGLLTGVAGDVLRRAALAPASLRRLRVATGLLSLVVGLAWGREAWLGLGEVSEQAHLAALQALR